MRTPDSIYEEIKRKIINLDLLPGTKVREEDLASEYNISRTPIRGVISRLVKDSLLEVAPKKGTYVSRIDVSNINDYIYVRKSVEESVLEIVCQNVTEQFYDNNNNSFVFIIVKPPVYSGGFRALTKSLQ